MGVTGWSDTAHSPRDAPVGRLVVADTVAGAASPGGLEKKKVCETQARGALAGTTTPLSITAKPL